MKAWIAREYSQELGLFLHRPKKGVCCWGIDVPMTHITEQDLPEGVNPQWDDDEPIEVKLNIERVKL